MSLQARKALSDCRLACEMLSDSIASGATEHTNVHWFTCLALLRAVGHILHKVDQKNFNKAQTQVANELFASWKKEPIFRDFIEEERNLILKQYSTSIKEINKTEEHTIITNDGLTVVSNDGSSVVINEIVKSIEKINGFSKGGTPPQIIEEAIQWWEEALDDFDSKAKNA